MTNDETGGREVDDLHDRVPAYALVGDVDLVVIRWDNTVSVFYGRCLHRGALLADGFVRGRNLICGLHDWDYRLDSGVSEYNNAEVLPSFTAVIADGQVLVDEAEIRAWAARHPQPYDRSAYLGLYADPHGTDAEPHLGEIQRLARDGLRRTGAHGPVGAMGVPGPDLPRWDDIQFVTAQLHRLPLLDDTPVATGLTVDQRRRGPYTWKSR